MFYYIKKNRTYDFVQDYNYWESQNTLWNKQVTKTFVILDYKKYA